MKVGAIIQARVSSARFPEKILKNLPYGQDITVLEQVLKRTLKSQALDEVIVATTIEKEDDKVIDIITREKVKFYRGSQEDVLARYYFAALENKLDIIVRITSDCPCIDAEIIDKVIEKHLEEKSDYTANTIKRTYPHGLDVEVFNFQILEHCHKNAHQPYEREHVTVYIRNNNIFKIASVEAPEALFAPDIRITLDTEEDYILLCIVYDYLYSINRYFTAYDIVNLFKEKPWLRLINIKVIQKKSFLTLEDELKEAVKILDLQDLVKARDFIKAYLAK